MGYTPNFKDGDTLHGVDLDIALEQAMTADNLSGTAPVEVIPSVTVDQLDPATTLSLTDTVLITQPSQSTGPSQIVQTTLQALLSFLQANLTGGGLNTVIIVSNPGQQNVGSSFLVSGTLTNYASPPTLRYSDDDGATWNAFPSGSSITNSAFSFTHPAFGSPVNGQLIQVTDTTGVTVGTSPTFNITALGESIALSAGGTVAQNTVVPISGTWSNIQPTALDYTTNGGSTWTAVTGLSFGSGNTWIASGPTALTAGTLTISVRDHTNTSIQSNAINVTVTSAEVLTLASASPITQGTVVALTGTWANAQPASIDYTTNGGTSWTTATGLTFGGGNSWSATGPTASTVGTLNIKIRDHTFTSIQSNTVSITVNAPAASVPSLPSLATSGQTLQFRLYADIETGQLYKDTALTQQAATGDLIYGIKDLSSVHNNFTDTAAGAGPTLTANYINGKKSLVYAGSQLTESDSLAFTDLLRTSSNVALFMVIKFPAALSPSAWLFRASTKANTTDGGVFGLKMTGSGGAIFGGRLGVTTSGNFPLNQYSVSFDPSWSDFTNKTMKILLRTVTGVGNVQKLDITATDGSIVRSLSTTYTNASGDSDPNSNTWDHFVFGGWYYNNTPIIQMYSGISDCFIITGTQQISDADKNSIMSYGTPLYGF